MGRNGLVTLKRTPIHDWHSMHGARFIEFHGWLLPVQFAGIKTEHCAVRRAAGLFDVSHMGEIRLKGPDAGRLAQWVLTRDLSDMQILEGRYSPMCREHGGIIDDLIIFRLGPDDYLLVVNAANREKDRQWLVEQTVGRFDALIEDESDDWALIALQGPQAVAILREAGVSSLPERPYRAVHSTLCGAECLISRTGYTGEDGFELFLPPEHALSLWEALLQAGKAHGLQPAGLGARDTLRLEASLPLYGNELNEERTPLETRLSRFVDWGKDSFSGKEALAKQKDEGVKKKIVGLQMLDRSIPRSHYPLIHKGEVVGEITSGTFAPWLQKGIALAWVDERVATPGTRLGVRIRQEDHHAEVCTLPFYSRQRSA